MDKLADNKDIENFEKIQAEILSKLFRFVRENRLISLTARVFVHVIINITFIFVAYSSVVSYSGLPYVWPQTLFT
jgi:hypothetical protein